MIKIKGWVLVVVAYIVCFNARAQSANQKALAAMRNVIGEMKAISQFEYDYSLFMQFPNGQKDQLKGTVYMNKSSKCMYNSNTATTIIYTKDWYYRADHKGKTISIIDLNKRYKKEQKAQFENEIFSNHYLDMFADSLMLQYAVVNNYQESGDVVNIDVGFSKKAIIKKIKLSFDDKKKLPVQFYIDMLYPWTGNDRRFKDKGTQSIMTCSNYTRGDNESKYRMDNFFTIQNGKVVLKKYTDYKLKTEL